MSKKETKTIVVTTSYEVQKTFIIEIPKETSLEDLDMINDKLLEECYNEEEDNYWESEEKIIKIENNN